MNSNEKINITDALLSSYLNDELNSISKEKVNLWIASSPENKTYFENLKKTWELSGRLDPKPVIVDANQAWNNVLSQIDVKSNEQEIISIGSRINRKTVFWSIAASIVILIGGFSLLKLNTTEINEISKFSENSVLINQLEDGSQVTLNANTILSYPEHFEENERRVELKGEAFFEIERNEEKPFIIDLPEASYVKVLGTSFNIKANETDSIVTVFVKTGKVEFGTSTSEKIILEAGEKGMLNRNTGVLTALENKTIGFKETYWIDQQVFFDHVNLNEVVDILNDIFEEEIILGCEEYEDSVIVTSHKEESLESILEVVASVHALSVEKEEIDQKKRYRLDCNAP